MLLDGDRTARRGARRTRCSTPLFARARRRARDDAHRRAQAARDRRGRGAARRIRCSSAASIARSPRSTARSASPTSCCCYRDEVERGASTTGSIATASSRSRRTTRRRAHDTLDAALAASGDARAHARLRAAPPRDRAAATASRRCCRPGMTRAHWLGKVVCSAGEHGFSAFALDVVQVMCEAMSQRLVDFNRERRHLAQFFAPAVISELLRDPGYDEALPLAARGDDRGAVRRHQQLHEDHRAGPRAAGGDRRRSSNRWSAGAVDLLWQHGGVFDKMVGDCVIGLFGPPFFRDAPDARAVAALRGGARDRGVHDRRSSSEPPYDRIPRVGIVPGLGVAIGAQPLPDVGRPHGAEPGLHRVLVGHEQHRAAAVARRLPRDARDGARVRAIDRLADGVARRDVRRADARRR